MTSFLFLEAQETPRGAGIPFKGQSTAMILVPMSLEGTLPWVPTVGAGTSEMQARRAEAEIAGRPRRGARVTSPPANTKLRL